MRSKAVSSVLLFTIFLLIVGITTGYTRTNKMVFGVVEKITFIPENVTLSAKLDTGAKTSSLGIIEMKIVEEDHGKGNEKWVHFTVNTKKKGKIYFAKKLEGYTKIKIRQPEKKIDPHERGYFSRPVVLMEIRLGDKQQLIPVNLANRKNFIYPFLLGRDAITQLGGIIDPSQRFIAKKVKISSSIQPVN